MLELFYPHVDIPLGSSCNPLLDDITLHCYFRRQRAKGEKTSDGVSGNQSTVAGKLDAVGYIRADVQSDLILHVCNTSC